MYPLYKSLEYKVREIIRQQNPDYQYPYLYWSDKDFTDLSILSDGWEHIVVLLSDFNTVMLGASPPSNIVREAGYHEKKFQDISSHVDGYQGYRIDRKKAVFLDDIIEGYDIFDQGNVASFAGVSGSDLKQVPPLACLYIVRLLQLYCFFKSATAQKRKLREQRIQALEYLVCLVAYKLQLGYVDFDKVGGAGCTYEQYLKLTALIVDYGLNLSIFIIQVSFMILEPGFLSPNLSRSYHLDYSCLRSLLYYQPVLMVKKVLSLSIDNIWDGLGREIHFHPKDCQQCLWHVRYQKGERVDRLLMELIKCNLSPKENKQRNISVFWYHIFYRSLTREQYEMFGSRYVEHYRGGPFKDYIRCSFSNAASGSGCNLEDSRVLEQFICSIFDYFIVEANRVYNQLLQQVDRVSKDIGKLKYNPFIPSLIRYVHDFIFNKGALTIVMAIFLNPEDKEQKKSSHAVEFVAIKKAYFVLEGKGLDLRVRANFMKVWQSGQYQSSFNLIPMKPYRGSRVLNGALKYEKYRIIGFYTIATESLRENKVAGDPAHYRQESQERQERQESQESSEQNINPLVPQPLSASGLVGQDSLDQEGFGTVKRMKTQRDFMPPMPCLSPPSLSHTPPPLSHHTPPPLSHPTQAQGWERALVENDFLSTFAPGELDNYLFGHASSTSDGQSHERGEDLFQRSNPPSEMTLDEAAMRETIQGLKDYLSAGHSGEFTNIEDY